MENFKTFFEQNYQGTEAYVTKIIKPIFGNLFEIADEDILKSNPNLKPAAERANILSIHRFGNCRLDVPMEFFDITLTKRVQLSQSRVYIQQLLRQIMQTYSAALIVFHYTDNQGDWRVSYISKGSNATDATSAKRYTYLMGENQKCRTAAERFAVLANSVKNEKNITDAFSVEVLTREFYKELFNWYQWALSSDNGFEVTYPNDTSTEDDDRKVDEHLIRLITRLMFVWFIKQKSLVPATIFKTEELKHLLTDFDPISKESGNYYNAILQNLFFATLNKKISEREFATDENYHGTDKHYGIKTLFRDAKEGSWFKKSKEDVIQIFNGVPFLNGGLFECLDKEIVNNKIFYYDGFSRESGRQKRAFLPNCLFFDSDKGIIPLLEKYNFTVEENTPSDVEVALDPELLGKVFENLLGAFNPETKETARKQSGSFYTPREIVNYMVDESLIAYLKNTCTNIDEATIRQLFTQDTLPDELKKSPENCKRLVAAIKAAKILDPACGSGAFPMGMLNRMLDLLQKLSSVAETSARGHALSLLQNTNYETKLYLIENCIYGIDIQTIAVQITKLRFFISLICEQTPSKDTTNNYGIIPLPNLETKFVAANTLIGLAKKEGYGNLFSDPTGEIDDAKIKLTEIRHRHFSATNAHQKKEFRKLDEQLRKELAKLLENNNSFAPEDAKQLADWNPYDQNTSSKFFDAEWMFGIKGGFDLVVGNPPYKVESKQNQLKYIRLDTLECGELYAYFFEKSINDFLKYNGTLSFITASLYIKGVKFKKLRKFLVQNSKLISLEVKGDSIFENVQMPTAVFIGSKSFKSNDLWSFDTFLLNLDIINKIKAETEPLSKICSIMRGFEIGRNQVKSTGSIEFITGSNICKWAIKKSGFISENIFSEFKKNESFFIGERLLIRETGSFLTVLYLVDKLYCNRSLYSIKICDYRFTAKFLASLLNSSLFQFYYQSQFKSDTELFPKIRIIQVKELPIKYLTNQHHFDYIVNQIISSKKINPQSETTHLDRQIDELVFKLYNLTYEEVLVVCPDFWLSEAEYEKIVVE